MLPNRKRPIKRRELVPMELIAQSTKLNNRPSTCYIVRLNTFLGSFCSTYRSICNAYPPQLHGHQSIFSIDSYDIKINGNDHRQEKGVSMYST